MNVAEEETEAKKPLLRLITGGKGPPTTSGEDWLNTLPKGCVFSCKKKGTTVELEVYGISFKHDKTVILFNALGNGPVRAVDPKEFSNQYFKQEVIEEGGERPEGSNNDSPQIRSSRVADDEDASGRQPSDEGS